MTDGEAFRFCKMFRILPAGFSGLPVDQLNKGAAAHQSDVHMAVEGIVAGYLCGASVIELIQIVFFCGKIAV